MIATYSRASHSALAPFAEIQEAVRRKRIGKAPWEWFDYRVRTRHEAMAPVSGRAAPLAYANKCIQRCLMADRADRPRVLYLHVPFCRTRCSHCSLFRKPCIIDACQYAHALERQIKQVSEMPWVRSHPFDAVYFGGGTPTVLEAERLASLVRLVGVHMPLSQTCEITVESRLGGIDEDYLRTLAAAGVSRLSFGVQTFNTRLRRKAGRHMNRESVLQVLETAENVGFRSVSIDMVYNLPGQSEADWEEDLRILAASPATGVSIYALTRLSGSAMAHAISASREEPLNGVDFEYTLFGLAELALVSRKNWRRLTPFHHGRVSRETCVYNTSRTGCHDVLGLGCGACGILGNISYMHNTDFDRFADTSSTEYLPVAGCAERPRAISERMAALALFDDPGMESDRLFELVPSFRETAESLLELGLLMPEQDRLRLTSDGCFWVYNLINLLSRKIAETPTPLFFLSTATRDKHLTAPALGNASTSGSMNAPSRRADRSYVKGLIKMDGSDINSTNDAASSRSPAEPSLADLLHEWETLIERHRQLLEDWPERYRGASHENEDRMNRKLFRETLIETVSVIEETKKSFKSRRLAELRQKLMGLLEEFSRQT